jgi:hypothetical protein
MRSFGRHRDSDDPSSMRWRRRLPLYCLTFSHLWQLWISIVASCAQSVFKFAKGLPERCSSRAGQPCPRPRLQACLEWKLRSCRMYLFTGNSTSKSVAAVGNATPSISAGLLCGGANPLLRLQRAHDDARIPAPISRISPGPMLVDGLLPLIRANAYPSSAQVAPPRCGPLPGAVCGLGRVGCAAACYGGPCQMDAASAGHLRRPGTARELAGTVRSAPA